MSHHVCQTEQHFYSFGSVFFLRLSGQIKKEIKLLCACAPKQCTDGCVPPTRYIFGQRQRGFFL